ncbi:MAG: hypothetical protein V3T77_09050, partial [Planctomycetota bacterium]
VRDANEDYVGLLLDYSLNDGLDWEPATPGGAGDGTFSVSTSVGGDSHDVSWSAQVDATGAVEPEVRLRITPVDVQSGTPGETLFFSVNLLAPSLDRFTVGDIPEIMNGSLPYLDGAGNEISFHLGVPSYGFTLNLEYQSALGGGDLDLATLRITADQTLGGVFPAGTNLAPFFNPDLGGGSWTLSEGQSIPLGGVTFETLISDEYGNVSTPLQLFLDVVPASPPARPFSGVDRWWLDFKSDSFSIGSSGGATITVTSTFGANGHDDFLEDLLIVGLGSESPTPQCAALNTNAILATWAKEEILGRLREHFGSSFDGSDEGYAPNLQFSFGVSGTHSSIRVGGDDLNPGFTLGRAQFDYRNAGGNQNRSPVLGVFTTNLIEFYINISPAFRGRFDVLIPGRGLPAGESMVDHVVLYPFFDRMDPGNSPSENSRYDQIASAMDAWGRSVAMVLAHEIGHSIGLCANGSPPLGLFGGVTGPGFSGPYTNSFHFDSPGNNLMASALSFSLSLISGSIGYHFNELNQSYLSEWIILEN